MKIGGMSPAKEVTRSGMELYTKKGDGGRSRTITRMNIPKNSPIFELLGTLDEFTSALGVAKRKAPASLVPLLEEIQGNVIALNGELAGGQKFATGEKVRQLEAAIDSLMENVPPFSGFILPGGSEGGAALDLARAVARRAERCAVAASQTGGVNRDVLAWMNRLSDLLYALARVCDRMTPAPAPAISPSPAVSDMTAPVMASALTADGFCDQAAALCRAVRLHAREQGLRVVAAVCDAGGNAVALQRDDDAYIASVDVASNKAFTAVSLKMTTEQVGRLAQPGAPLYGVQHTNQGRIVIFGGGAPLMRGGVIVGGLGVSGGSAEQDTALCDYGVQLFEKEMETLGF